MTEAARGPVAEEDNQPTMTSTPNVFDNLPLPEHYDPEDAGRIFRVPYAERAAAARAWASAHRIPPSGADQFRVGLWLIDVQNTFCHPEFELFVAGSSGRGAVDDSARLSAFVYRNLGLINQVHFSLDTHEAIQIFHPVFFLDERGEHPEPMTAIALDDVLSGRIRVNPDIVSTIPSATLASLQDYLKFYCRRLAEAGKYELMVWPYHAMLGGIGHALVSVVEEAAFFHGIARTSRPRFVLKGQNARTENYSVLRPEVQVGPDGEGVCSANGENAELLSELLDFDALIVAGQAKSHCVAWTVADLLDAIRSRDPKLADRVYLLDDCASPVVAPGIVDFSAAAETAYERFAAAGMHRVCSTAPPSTWPGPLGRRAVELSADTTTMGSTP